MQVLHLLVQPALVQRLDALLARLLGDHGDEGLLGRRLAQLLRVAVERGLALHQLLGVAHHWRALILNIKKGGRENG